LEHGSGFHTLSAVTVLAPAVHVARFARHVARVEYDEDEHEPPSDDKIRRACPVPVPDVIVMTHPA
jgi:hypothetical protein